jgi:hypothetical protein
MTRSLACGPIGLLMTLLAVAAATAQEPATTQPATRPAKQPTGLSQPASQPTRTAPEAGEVAPTFKLKALDGKTEFELTSLRGKRPVVLLFGSYT